MMIPAAAATLLLALTARTVTLEEAERAAAGQRPDIHLADANLAAGLARNEEARAPLLPQVIAIAVVFSGLVGVGFGLYPARKASRLDPIEALRFE